MASIIKADTLQSTTANVFVLNSSGTEYARFDSDGDLGIGTASPADKLHVAISSGSLGGIRVQNTDSGGQSAVSYYNDAATQKADIWWNNSGSTLNLRTLSTDPMIFSTNNSERMRVNAGAPILCLSGGSTTATGTGIAFPATQSASSDPNTLDDYEEGTWSPVVTAESGSITTYAINSANYTKTGNTVFVYVRFTVSDKGTGSNFVVSGLPFTSAAELLGNWAETNLLGLTGFMFTAGTGATSFNSRNTAGWGLECLANGSYTVQVTYRVQ